MQQISVLTIICAILQLSGAIRCSNDYAEDSKAKDNYACDVSIQFCATVILPKGAFSECGVPFLCQKEGSYNSSIGHTVCCCKGDNCNADKQAIVAAARPQGHPSDGNNRGVPASDRERKRRDDENQYPAQYHAYPPVDDPDALEMMGKTPKPKKAIPAPHNPDNTGTVVNQDPWNHFPPYDPKDLE